VNFQCEVHFKTSISAVGLMQNGSLNWTQIFGWHSGSENF